jgi:hypothetical protein
MLVGLVGRMIGGRRGFILAFAIAIVIGVGWEIVEHTSWVMNRFRATTIYRGYWGDSALNAVSDYLFMLGGFYVASRIRISFTLLLMAALEIASAVVVRDSLILATIRVLYPIKAISDWQNRGDPRLKANAPENQPAD